MAAAKDEDVLASGKYFALDPAAAHQPRVHRLPSNPMRDVVFGPGQKVEVPWSDAKRLMQIGFEVYDDNGNRMRMVEDATEDGQPITLRSDQVVAELKELTVDALVDRARDYPGGGEMNKGTGKAALIQFLVDRRNEEQEKADARKPGGGKRDADGYLVMDASDARREMQGG